MRILDFPKYDVTARPVPAHARGWALLWLSVNGYPAGNRDQTLVGNSALLLLKSISEVLDAEGDSRRLQAEGGMLYFEDAEFRVLRQALDKFRENVSLANADALIFLDESLEKAKEISKEAFKKLSSKEDVDN